MPPVKQYLPALLLVVLCSNNALAQLGYGAEVGVGMSSMHFAPAIGFTSASKTPVLGAKAGGIIDAGINKHIYFQSGLYCSLKGQTRHFAFHLSDSVNEAVSQTLHLAYFDLPLNLCYKTGIQGKGRVIMGIGATLSYILGGSNKLSSQGADSGRHFNTNISAKVSPGSPLKAFDLGVNLFAGYEMPTGWFFRAYYTAGTNDLGLGTEIDKNRAWDISVGYLLGKGRNINKETDDLIDRSKD